MLRSLSLIGVLALFVAAGDASAVTIDHSVGAGADTSIVQIQFGNDSLFGFEVAYDAGAVTRFDLLEIIEAALASFTLDLQFFGTSPFVNGISFGSDSDVGFGGGENYWHFWVKSAEADPWVLSSLGAGSLLAVDGSFDGWRYGSAQPIPEPGTALLVSIGLAGLAWRGRRTRNTPS